MRAFDASRAGGAVAGATAGAAPATSGVAARSGTGYPRTRGVLTPCTALSGAESGTQTHRTGTRWSLAPEATPGLEWTPPTQRRTTSCRVRPRNISPRADRHDPDDALEANGLGPLGNGPAVRDRTVLQKETPVRRHPGSRGGLRPRRPQFKHRRHMPAHRGAVPTIARSVDPAMTITPLPGLDGTAHRSGNATASGRAATGLEKSDKGSTAGERRNQDAGEPHPKKHARGCGFPCAYPRR